MRNCWDRDFIRQKFPPAIAFGCKSRQCSEHSLHRSISVRWRRARWDACASPQAPQCLHDQGHEPPLYSLKPQGSKGTGQSHQTPKHTHTYSRYRSLLASNTNRFYVYCTTIAPISVVARLALKNKKRGDGFDFAQPHSPPSESLLLVCLLGHRVASAREEGRQAAACNTRHHARGDHAHTGPTWGARG